MSLWRPVEGEIHKDKHKKKHTPSRKSLIKEWHERKHGVYVKQNNKTIYWMIVLLIFVLYLVSKFKDFIFH